MRLNLKNARNKANMTQKDVADYLGISERHYRFLETGDRNGNFETWDKLEDLFSVHQRRLREISTN